MTVIAAYYDKATRTGAIGWDDSGWLGEVCVRNPGKAVRLGLAIIGLAGHRFFRRAVESYAPLTPALDAQEWCEGLADHVAEWARHRGHGKVHEGSGIWNCDCWLLVLTPDGIWNVSPGGDATIIMEPYAAIGSGQPIALGALAALSMTCPGEDPPFYVERALKVCVRHGDGVGGGYSLESSPEG